MWQVVLIKPDEKNRLPAISDLRAAGFLISSALYQDEGAEVTRPVKSLNAGGTGRRRPSTARDSTG